MTVDLDAVVVALAQVLPVVGLAARESARWRAELAAWRDQLAGARIIIEPAAVGRSGGPARAAEVPVPGPVDPTQVDRDDDTDDRPAVRRHATTAAPWSLPMVDQGSGLLVHRTRHR